MCLGILFIYTINFFFLKKTRNKLHCEDKTNNTIYVYININYINKIISL